MKIKCYINNELINDPNNLSELGIELNYDTDNPSARVGINEWELGIADRFNTDGAKLSNAHLSEGLTGGVGVFEGLPFRIDLEKNGNIETVFNGYLDLSKGNFQCDLVTTEAVEVGGVDWLNSGVADSFTYEYLYDQGILNEDDFILVPYVISRLPQSRDAILLLVSAFVVITEFKNQLQALIEYISAISNPLSFQVFIQITLRIAYLSALLLTALELITDIIRAIIEPVKYHAGMRLKKLCEIGCAHLGLIFESPIFDQENESKLTWLPEKFKQLEDEDGILGFLTNNAQEQKGFFKGTFGDLLRVLKTMFNAKIIVNNGVLKLVRRDYNDSIELYQLPPIEGGGFRLNYEDFSSNYLLEFLVDYNDKNTVQEYLGTSVQVQTLPITVINENMVSLKGLNTINLQCALGKRKTDLSVPEKVINGLFEALDFVVDTINSLINGVITVVNAAIDVINGIFNVLDFLGILNNPPTLNGIQPINLPSPSNILTDRIDLMKMENDFISVPKIVMVDDNSSPRNNVLLPQNEEVVSANYLWENYHYINSFDSEEYDQHNQYKIYKLEDVPFCYSDFLLVKNNNKILDSAGLSGELISLTWNLFSQSADIEFKINDIYTNNLRTVKIVPDGR